MQKDILSGGAWGRPAVGVAASTSELPDSSSDCAHAAEGFTFVEFLIKLALEELIVKLASLTPSPEDSYVYVISDQQVTTRCKKRRKDALSGCAWGRPALGFGFGFGFGFRDAKPAARDHPHAADGFAFVEFLIKLALEELIVELASLTPSPEDSYVYVILDQ